MDPASEKQHWCFTQKGELMLVWNLVEEQFSSFYALETQEIYFFLQIKYIFKTASVKISLTRSPADVNPHLSLDTTVAVPIT